jgi:DNA-binding transcriptional MocR family regulator
VEDGFDGTLFYAERPPAPLKALDRTGLVVYIGTFSKILFPGLRLGWIVAAPELVDRLEMAKDLSDIHTSPLIQAAVYHFCRQRRRSPPGAGAARYGRRRNALLTSLERQCRPGCGRNAGDFALVTLPERMNTVRPLLEPPSSRVYARTGVFVDGAERARLSFSACPSGRSTGSAPRRDHSAERQPERRARDRQSAVPLV